MANNQYVNKVVYDGGTLIDITDTTAEESDVTQGKYFYKADGSKAVGTRSGEEWTINDTSNLFANGSRTNIMDELLSRVENVTITANMFYANTQVRQVDFTKDMSMVTNAGNMFYNCSYVTLIKLGKSGKSFRTNITTTNMFYNCSSLQKLVIYGTNVLRLAAANALQGMRSTCEIYVPDNLVSQYKSASIWSTRASYIKPLSEYTA